MFFRTDNRWGFFFNVRLLIGYTYKPYDLLVDLIVEYIAYYEECPAKLYLNIFSNIPHAMIPLSIGNQLVTGYFVLL